MAQRYEALKDRVATVELDAHRKAQTTLDEAESQVAQLRQDAAQWVAQLSGSYEAIRDQVRPALRRPRRPAHAFEAAEEDYQSLRAPGHRGSKAGERGGRPMSQTYHLTTQELPAKVAALRAGDRVVLTGTIYTARDAAHKRLFQLLDEGKPLPFDLKGAVIYYAGPTPGQQAWRWGPAAPPHPAAWMGSRPGCWTWA